jgi:hypothetical protein
MIWPTIAVLIAIATAALITIPAATPHRAAKPEVWCADPAQTDSGPLQFCEFKLRDA